MPHTVLSKYWKRAGHCCDPDESVTEMIAALESAGFVIVPSGTVADMRECVTTWDATSGYSPLIERIREWIGEAAAVVTADKPKPCTDRDCPCHWTNDTV